jgi:pimeloyl-ACP methyl ester carboxylesterase
MSTGYYQNHSVTTRYQIDGEGPVLALIHGVGGRLETWDPLLQEFGQGYRVLRYDLRGFGESTKIKGRYELGSYVEDFVALLDHLEIDRCHVLGFSLGGIIAQAVALVYPGRVNRLVLCSTIAGVNPEDRAFLRERYVALKTSDPEDHFRRSINLYFSPEYQKAHPEVIAEMEARRKEIDPECFAAAYRIIAETDMEEDLPNVKARTLVMTGEFDRASPQMAAVMADRIPDSQLVVFEGLRHNLPTENPTLLAHTIRKFLDS